jgi:hypothetical protein
MIVDNETAFLLNAVTNIYGKLTVKAPDIREICLNKLFVNSMDNKLAYYVSNFLLTNYLNQIPHYKVKWLKCFIEACDKKVKKLSQVTSMIVNSLDQYIIHKTYKGFTIIPNDIDVIVPNLRDGLRRLKYYGMKTIDVEKHQVMLMYEDVKIHLHDKISWADSTFLDDDIVYTNPRSANLWSVEVKIPNYEADFLINIAHINFELLHLNLLDFLYLCNIASQIKWEIVLEQATKYKWRRALLYTILLFDEIFHLLYLGTSPFNRLKLKHNLPKRKHISFPVILPRSLIITAFLEKRPFNYLTQKIYKSFYIMITGDTYKVFYTPPEKYIIPNCEVI